MHSLNIFMQEIELCPGIIQDNDTIRVSVTTLPGEQKQAFTFGAKEMRTAHPFFSVKIDDKTDTLLIVIRKKNFSQKDPIIASTFLKRAQLPTKFNDNTNTEVKIIKLLEPVCQTNKKNTKTGSKRQSIGQITIQFSLSEEMAINKNRMKIQNNKKRNGHGYTKFETLLDDENACQTILFNAPITN